MRRIISVAGSLLFATLLFAQEPAAKPATAEARMQAIHEHQQQMFTKLQEAMKAADQAAEQAKAKGEPVPATPMRPDYGPLVKEAQAAAKEFAGTEDAVQFLVMAMQMAAGADDKPACVAALDTLAKDHVDSKELASLGEMMPYLGDIVGEEKAKTLLEAFKHSKDAEVSGWATFAGLQKVIEQAPRDGSEYVAAKATLKAIASKLDSKRLKSEITDVIDLREKFGAGTRAPDIEGEDLDGVAFKLSDYKGKIIFLDFWGDW